MQTGKNAAASAKEAAGNVAASAKAGMEKTKAAVQGQVDKMSAHNPIEKEAAQQRKDERIHQAETDKQEALAENAANKEATRADAGVAGHPTGHGTGLTHHESLGHHGSADPGHATGAGGASF